MERHGIWLAGREAHGRGAPLAVVAPYTGEAFAEVDTAGPEDVAEAVGAAHAAFRGVMRAMPVHRRVEILHRAAALLAGRAEDLARTLAREGGKPIRLARAEARRGGDILTLAAEAARHGTGEVIPMDALPGGEDRMGLAIRVPLGVVAAISPFNAPINLSLQKIAPAVAAGCSAVLKPAEQASLTALQLGRLFRDAGLPAGALSVLPGGAETGRALAGDPRVAVVSFTGSAEVAERIQAEAGLKKLVLELGSNAPNIVCAGADLDYAAESLVQAGFGSSGQVCVSAQRIYVQAGVYRSFLDRFLPLVAALRVGDPLDESVSLGPLVTLAALERVEAWVAEAVSEGAAVLAGGRRQGRSYLPTVLAGVTPTMKVQCREVFGPVVTVTPFGTTEEAVALANDAVYGLQAGVFTRDLTEALTVARDLEFGSVWINDSSRYRQDNTPFGGVKRSGMGREGAKYALEAFTELKFIGLRLR